MVRPKRGRRLTRLSAAGREALLAWLPGHGFTGGQVTRLMARDLLPGHQPASGAGSGEG